MNPTQRLYKIRQKSHGDKMELVMTWPVDNMGQSEKMIHELFANKRLQGEWFTLKGEDLYTMNSTLKGKNDLPLSLEVDVRENGLQPKPSSSNTAVEHQTAREEDDTALLAQESQKRETAPVEGPPDPLREFKAWVEPMVPGWARGKARKAWREPDDQEALRQIFVVRALHEIQACWELFITPGTKSYDHAVGQRFAMREFQRQMEYLITDEKYPTLKRRYLDRMAAGAPG